MLVKMADKPRRALGLRRHEVVASLYHKGLIALAADAASITEAGKRLREERAHAA